MRVLVDTNVLISGLLWDGNESNLLRMCKTGELTNLISPPIFEELEKVLSGRKFGLTANEVSKLIELVISFSDMVHPQMELTVVTTDADDNRILECALAGKADYIVSGDKHLLKLGEFKGMPIINAKEMLKIIQNE